MGERQRYATASKPEADDANNLKWQRNAGPIGKESAMRQARHETSRGEATRTKTDRHGEVSKVREESTRGH